jgi:hypothetical protein
VAPLNRMIGVSTPLFFLLNLAVGFLTAFFCSFFCSQRVRLMACFFIKSRIRCVVTRGLCPQGTAVRKSLFRCLDYLRRLLRAGRHRCRFSDCAEYFAGDEDELS